MPLTQSSIMPHKFVDAMRLPSHAVTAAIILRNTFVPTFTEVIAVDFMGVTAGSDVVLQAFEPVCASDPSATAYNYLTGYCEATGDVVGERPHDNHILENEHTCPTGKFFEPYHRSCSAGSCGGLSQCSALKRE